MNWPPPLRFVIPLALLLFAGTTGIITVQYGRQLQTDKLEQRYREQAQFVGTKLSVMSAFFLENASPAGAQREIALAAADRDLVLAVSFNEHDRVLHSSRYDLLNVELADTAAAKHSELLKRARAGRAGVIEMSPDRDTLYGAFPFPIIPRTGGAFRDTEFGVVFLEFDLSARKAIANASFARLERLGAAVLFGLCAVFSLLFGPLLTSRIARLRSASRELAAGNLTARARLGGSDELADLSKAFDQMAADLERGSAELRESEGRFRLLVEGIPQVFWLAELEPERVLYVGPAFDRIWGFSAEAVYQNPRAWSDAIHPAERTRVTETFLAWMEGRAPTFEEVFRITRPDGEERWIRDRGVRLDSAPGGKRRITGIAEDITVQRQSEIRHSELERKLWETQKLESLGVLAGGIAHDFNNLLTGILGNASLAAQEVAMTNPAQAHIAQIESTALRASDLCKQMLAYSGKGRFQIQRLDLSALVHETAQLIRLSISKTAVLRFSLAAKLPSIEVDSTQIRQVIMNLIINASEASGEKGAVIGVSTGTIYADREYLDHAVLSPELPVGNYVFLEVSDNGCGMTTETQARIFEPFFTTKFTGRGLGLSAVLGIVRGHRGAMKIYSEPGKGSTFKLFFPASEGAPEQLASAVQADNWSGAGRMLLVDDDQTVRAVAARMLEKLGFTPIIAMDGSEGVELFRKHHHEIVAVLMDLTMPNMDGEQAFREMRVIDGEVRVILMSGFNEQEAINRFTGKGLAGFIQKPFKHDQLRRKLKEVIEG